MKHPRKYRPIADAYVTAIKWTGDNADAVLAFAHGHATHDADVFRIDTVSGRRTAAKGDYIVKGAAGDFYPCNPDAFERGYEDWK